MFHQTPNVELPMAPELSVCDWLNTNKPITLEQLRGKVVILHAFQMLCPGCVSHGIPQAKLLRKFYVNDPVEVIGLHSVFEHHSAMQKHALEAFIHEYRLTFPIAIDQEGDRGPIPKTMEGFALRGTPSIIVIDQVGKIRLNHFGHLDNLAIGSLVGSLLADRKSEIQTQGKMKTDKTTYCDESGCAI